jgi:lysozyme
MKISQEGIALIKVFEGCKLESYLCAAGVWTIGYGHTKMVEEGQEITQEEADNILLNDLEIYEEAVLKAVEVPLHQHQFDALVSWTFNLGGANLNASTMLKVINKGEYEDVPAQIKRWNKAGGKVLQGLIRRREAEALLFEGKDWENGTK